MEKIKKAHKCDKIVLSERQERWLIREFKHTKNEEIADKLGISVRSVTRIARKLGLQKSTQFTNKCLKHLQESAYISHVKNGTFPPKGFIIPRSNEFYFKKGETCLDRIGPKREAERLKKAMTSLAKTRKSERARAVFGLPQKTKLRVTRQSAQKIAMRCYLKKKGYIIDDEKRIAYYDENTRRGKRIEVKNQPWYKFLPVNDSPKIVNAISENQFIVYKQTN